MRSEPITLPRHPVAAVTHADPYPYYAHLTARQPVYRDEGLGLWVASSAEAVIAVLASELCRVRPPGEPIPRALLGSPAGEIFGHLVRMNDGPSHAKLKPAVSSALNAIDTDIIMRESRRWAGALASELDLMEFVFGLSAYVIGTLLGIPRASLPQAAAWTGEFVLCLAPTSTSEQIEQGKLAAGHLLELFRSLHASQPSDTILSGLAGAATRAGHGDPDLIAANGIGMLSQAHEATAGLIGNSLLALASHRDVRAEVGADPDLLAALIQEVLRFDPPVQNTRRYLARSGTVAGRDMKDGDAVLVVVAAANRDPSANTDPERFDIRRKDRRYFTFGAGAHACPGEALATTIAGAGVAELLRSGIDLERLAETATYRVSVNTRVPLFQAA